MTTRARMSACMRQASTYLPHADMRGMLKKGGVSGGNRIHECEETETDFHVPTWPRRDGSSHQKSITLTYASAGSITMATTDVTLE